MGALRDRLDAYAREKYGIEPEVLPFSGEEYGVYRHADTGKWFAVFIVKDRRAFGLPGTGRAEAVSFRIRDRTLADLLARQPGYLRGFPARGWNWTTALLDGTVPFEDICRWLDESRLATASKTRNKRVPLPGRESGEGRPL